MKNRFHFRISLGTFIFLVILSTAAFSQLPFTGVNLAGAEFGGSHLPGTYNQHYTYPIRAEVDYFVGKSMNTFRLPFKWERLQHSEFADLNAAELSRIKNFVEYATSKNAYTILDPHNYARYYGQVIGKELPVEAFADFWQKLASEFKENSLVIFGLMNEPHGMETELWLSDANAAIEAIRSTGAENLILVPGNAYTGAHSWTSNWYGTPNGTVMQNVVDPLDNYAFDLHQYFDDNSSGTSESCVNTTIGSQRLKNVTNWLRQHNERGFLGEFGVSTNETCLQALDDMLAYMDENSDVWLGWTYWAAGPWWGDYMFSIEPRNGQDRPQMDILEQHLGGSSAVTNAVYRVNDFSMSQNYPNPFNGATRIDFEISRPGQVQIIVYDVLGNQVSLLLDQQLSSGRHSIQFSTTAANLASGIYFYKLIYENKTWDLKRMLLMQ